MVDIGERLEQLLSSPDGMQKLQDAASQLQGILGEGGDITALLSGVTGNSAPPAEKPDLSLLAKAAPLFAVMQQEDDGTRLLRALRPYLGEERAAWVDDALQILKWLRLIPLLKEQGVL